MKWERFAGRTDRFALRLSILADPDDGAAALSEDSASWGTFELWVEGRNLCAHVDQGEALSAAHWYLLPLVEWLAENWNALLHEERLPVVNSADTGVASLAMTRNAPAISGEIELLAWEEEWFAWRARHALRSARCGGLWPNIVIRRLRDYVEVSWDDEPDAGSPPGFGFTSSVGGALFHPEEVAEPLHEVLSAFVEFMVGLEVAPGRIGALRERLASLPGARQDGDRLSWLAGLSYPDRETPDETRGHEVRHGWDLIVAELTRPHHAAEKAAALEVDRSSLVVNGACTAALMFASVSPTVAPADIRTLSTVLLDQYSEPPAERELSAFVRDDALDPRVPAWEQGYELAESFHDELGLDLTAGWVDVETLLDELGVEVVGREILDPEIRACSLVGPHHRPTIVHNRLSRMGDAPGVRRFTAAHELCHLLHDRAQGARLAIASGPWAPRGIERRAGAFAAMFLMPTDLVASTVAGLPTPVNELEGITQFATALRVSRAAAIHHVFNLTLMSEADRDELLRQAQRGQ